MTKHSKKGAGGKRAGSGPKTNYAKMQVQLPPDDKEKIKQKYGRSFNQLFRAWIKTLIG
jgi:hypothetical protein